MKLNFTFRSIYYSWAYEANSGSRGKFQYVMNDQVMWLPVIAYRPKEYTMLQTPKKIG